MRDPKTPAEACRYAAALVRVKQVETMNDEVAAHYEATAAQLDIAAVLCDSRTRAQSTRLEMTP